jgi:hypothetical protein
MVGGGGATRKEAGRVGFDGSKTPRDGTGPTSIT